MDAAGRPSLISTEFVAGINSVGLAPNVISLIRGVAVAVTVTWVFPTWVFPTGAGDDCVLTP